MKGREGKGRSVPRHLACMQGPIGRMWAGAAEVMGNARMGCCWCSLSLSLSLSLSSYLIM